MQKGFTAIVDYGVGNLRSLINAFSYLGMGCRVTADASELERADAILLPGVGAFPAAAEKLWESGMGEAVRTQVGRKPLLGVCLGMQLLFERSEEGRSVRGIGILDGEIRRIDTPLKLPHIGWNALKFPRTSRLMAGVDEGSFVYFVHSYCADARAEDVLAVTEYGAPVTAAVGRGGVYGCQFHPEKSGEAGLQILRNFGEMNR